MILYLHGFNSSPQSHKAKLLGRYLAERGLAAHYACPSLPPLAPDAVREIERSLTQEHLCFVGSSLGGFYATYFAEKHAAVWPSTLRGAYWRAWFDVGISARLARSAFSPVPSVDAAVLRIVRRDRPLVALDDHDAYRRFLAGAFAARAPLAKALHGRVTQRELRRLGPVLGFDTRGLPRDLDARQWALLFGFATRG